jgi:rhamnosyl/mannosyltransferase
VLPSVSELEGFGVVQIEAMALGKPVVTSDLKTGVTWVNRHGETGLVFPAGDAAAFADACNRLAADPLLARRLGDRARERTRAEFSWTALRREFSAFLAALRAVPSR